MTAQRRAVLQALRSLGGSVREPSGRATEVLFRQMATDGYTGDVASVRQLLRPMADAGLIWRDTRSTRTYALRALHEAGIPPGGPVVAPTPDPPPRPTATVARTPSFLARPAADRAAAPTAPPPAAGATGRPADPAGRDGHRPDPAGPAVAAVAAFVDFAWLVGQAGHSCHGERDRSRLDVDLDLLAGTVDAVLASYPRRLRAYWYDRSTDGPSPGQQRLARVPGVKLRLLEVARSDRSGLEALLVRDLLLLAATGKVATVVVAAGHHVLVDVLETVRDLGVRVVLLTTPGPAGEAGVNALAPAADAVRLLDRPSLAAAVRRRGGPAHPVPPTAPPTARRPRAAVDPLPAPAPAPDGAGEMQEEVEQAGAAFAVRWSLTATTARAIQVLQGAPDIPTDIGVALMQRLHDELDVGPASDASVRRAAQVGFWRGLRALTTKA